VTARSKRVSVSAPVPENPLCAIASMAAAKAIRVHRLTLTMLVLQPYSFLDGAASSQHISDNRKEEYGISGAIEDAKKKEVVIGATGELRPLMPMSSLFKHPDLAQVLPL
jgi:hypothetical protein